MMELISPPTQTLQQHRQAIRANIATLATLTSTTTYPQLSKLLLSRNATLYNKLLHIHNYALSYGSDERQRWSRHPVRGWEFMGSLDNFVKLYGGSKRTWKTCLDKFHVLGLMGLHKPRLDDPEGRYNTDVQNISVKRAKARRELAAQAAIDFGEPPSTAPKAYPVTWHRIPLYTSELLQQAEQRVPDVIAMGNGINKDAILDMYGTAEANRITDTGYNTHPETLARRFTLSYLLLSLIESRGYTTSQELLQQAMQICPGHSYYRWNETWRAYKPHLFREYHLKESRPSKLEKELFQLASDAFIIRKA